MAFVPILAALVLASGPSADSLPPLPDFQLQNLKNEPAGLSEYRVKIVVLNFWVTGCVPCRRERGILAVGVKSCRSPKKLFA